MKITSRIAGRLVAFAALAWLGGVGAEAQSGPTIDVSTYLGGSDLDEGSGIALDLSGNAYVVGSTASVDFPTVGGMEPPLHERELFFPRDMFAAKLAPAGSVAYSTYVTSPFDDVDEVPTAVAVDREGSAHLTGFLSAFDVQPIVVELEPSGAGLEVFEVITSPNLETGADIAVDPQGFAWVTWASDFDHFGRSGTLPSLEIWVMRIAPGSFPPTLYSFGGSAADFPEAIAIDAAGHVYVMGYTRSPDFPIVAAARPSLSGAEDAFLMKLDPDDGSILYSTYLGGSSGSRFEAGDLAVSAAGDAVVVGLAAEADVETRDPLQPAPRGGLDLFVASLDPAGALRFATYWGGSADDTSTGVALGPTGAVYLTGSTESADFPVLEPLATGCTPPGSSGCGSDAFVTVLAADGRRVLGSLTFGGSGRDEAYGIGVDAAGAAWIAGTTESRDLPTVDAFQTTYGGGPSDAFAAKIAFNQPPDCSAAVASPAVLWPPNGKLVPVSVRGVTDPDGDPVQITITGVTQDEPLTGPFDASGVGGSTALLRALRDGRGDGRVYRVGFEADDGSGGTCAGTVTVCVPHDRRPGGGCRDGGALVGSSGS